MTKAEIERNYQNEWFRYKNGVITPQVLREHVEYFASLMSQYDKDRANQMLYSVSGM